MQQGPPSEPLAAHRVLTFKKVDAFDQELQATVDATAAQVAQNNRILKVIARHLNISDNDLQ